MRDAEKKRAYNKQWAKEHKEEHTSYMREYRESHPEYVEKDNKRAKYDRQRYLGNPLKFISATRRRKYGITQEEFESRIKAQKNLCAICFRQMGVPHIDHDHRTGKNRELLCKNCNTALGLFYENEEILSSAIRYIQKHNNMSHL